MGSGSGWTRKIASSLDSSGTGLPGTGSNGRAGLSALDGTRWQRLDGAKPGLTERSTDSLADTDQADFLRPCSGKRLSLTCRGEAARDLRLSRSRAGVNESLAWLGHFAFQKQTVGVSEYVYSQGNCLQADSHQFYAECVCFHVDSDR